MVRSSRSNITVSEKGDTLRAQLGGAPRHRGVFIGRFQPFHKGHLLSLERLLREVDEVIVAVGSSQRSHETRNPFTAGERIYMIRAAIRDSQIPDERIWIIPIHDLDLNPLWVSHVRSYCPPFQRVYSNNSLVKVLFNEANIPVHPIPMFHREQYSSTLIRTNMIQNKEWRHFVPPIIAKIIDDLKGAERVQALAETDTVS